MGTLRGYNEEDISDSSGEVEVWAQGPHSTPGLSEEMGMFRLRLRTHTPEDPYTGGQVLVTVRWHDGNGEQSWPLALATSEGNYSEQGNELWVDNVRAVTLQVEPYIGSGTIDVLMIYKER